ncbi:MAG: alpha/beta hydrolase-fold protein [Pirellulaceae bacterium]|jgi:phospholipase/carboxylesterase|nr:alpha/beta hydrolase-fold protein [Pirellulaceae bacterium]
MKRHQVKPTLFSTLAGESPQLEHALAWTAHEGDGHCAVFAPLHYERNYAYPLVVWLHGPGQDERQLLRIMPEVSMRNYVAVAPRGPQARGAVRGAGYGWSLDDDLLVAIENAVFGSIDTACARYHIARHRIFLVGHERGGTLAFWLGMRHPRKFAGVASLCGPFPSGRAPLAHFDEAREVPVFLAHGRHSESYPVETACAELRLFHAAGMNVTLRQYPGGDDLHPQMLRDVNAWLMEQVTGMPSTEAESLTPLRGDEF